MAPQADNIYAINETIDYTLVNADKKSEEEIHKQLLLIANELAKLEASFNGFESVTSDPDAAEISAMESAVKNARRKAQALAKLADGNLGKILNIEPVELESEDDMETMFNNMFMGVMPGLGFGANPYGLANGIRTRISSKCKLKITFELTD